jgi:hypothetical protein
MRETMTGDALMSRHTAAWQAATVHPFLAGVRDGSWPKLPPYRTVGVALW